MTRPGVNFLFRFFAAILLSIGISFLVAFSWGDSARAEESLQPSLFNETEDRVVDAVANSSQESAINKLLVLVKKYHNTRQEPVLLAKLAELQTQSASIKFRIAHENAHRGKKSLDLTQYKKTMTQAIKSYSEVISRFPNYEELHHLYFMRGRAFEETDNTAKATQDYLYLAAHYPEAEETISAHMSLAEFSIKANQHQKAIQYLEFVEKHPESPHYPYALYKLGWSHFNLKGIPKALSYVEKHVAYFKNQKNNATGAVVTTTGGKSSDEALLENSLLDSTVFYMEGFEQKLAQYQVKEALTYFRKLEQGPMLGKMLIRFSKLLRSHGYEQDLIAWKNEVLEKEDARPESIDVLITAYDFQLAKRRFADLLQSSADMVRLYKKFPKYEGFTRAQKLLLETAETLQAMVLKNKDADGVRELSKTLAGVYLAFTQVIEDTDPRVNKAHYNLAETLFEIKDYAQSTGHYRWIVDHGRWDKDFVNATPIIADASLKAINARYQLLKDKKLIPETIEAKPLTSQVGIKLDPMLTEWVKWVDTHTLKTGKVPEDFFFESARCLYAIGDIKESITRLQDFAIHQSNSKYAIAAATLVLDTHLASKNWEKAHDLADQFQNIKTWKDSDFKKKLYNLAADSLYKLIEEKYKAGEYRLTTWKMYEFFRRYDKSPRLGDALYLAASASLYLGEKDKALEYFTRHIKEAPQAETMAAALLSRANIYEEQYFFAEAARDYRQYLARTPKAYDAIRKKTLIYAWLSGSASELSETSQDAAVCTANLALECSKYKALAKWAEGLDKDFTQDLAESAFENAKKSEGESKVIWAALALQGAKFIAYKDRLTLIKNIATNWNDLDAMVRFSLVSPISQSIPKAFALNRNQLNDLSPLKPNPKSIKSRVEAIQELENVATKVAKLPWARLRATMLNEVASLYLDLAKSISNLPAPKGLSEADLQAYDDTVKKLVIPFEEKGQDIRSKAFEIASRFAVEDSTFEEISAPFFQDNPSQAKALKPEQFIIRTKPIDVEFLAKMDPKGDWDSLKLTSSNPEIRLKAHWAQALKKKQWHLMAYFLQEGQEKAFIKSNVAGLVKAVSWVAAGARAEGLQELEESKTELTVDQKRELVMTLLSHFTNSLSKEKTTALIAELKKLMPSLELAIKEQEGRKPSSDTNSILYRASKWAGGKT